MAVSAIVGADQATAVTKPTSGIAPGMRRESPIRAINFARLFISSSFVVCCDSQAGWCLAMRPCQRGWQFAVPEVPTKRLKTDPRSPKFVITPQGPHRRHTCDCGPGGARNFAASLRQRRLPSEIPGDEVRPVALLLVIPRAWPGHREQQQQPDQVGPGKVDFRAQDGLGDSQYVEVNDIEEEGDAAEHDERA